MDKLRRMSLTLKITTIISAMMTAGGILLIIGSVGGLEWNTMSIADALKNSIIGLLITAIAAILTNRLQEAEEYVDAKIRAIEARHRRQRRKHLSARIAR